MAKWKEIDTPDPHAIVKAALERAMGLYKDEGANVYVSAERILTDIRALADCPEAVTEIIAAAAKEKE